MAITTARFGVARNETASAAAPSTTATQYASHGGTTPAAIGRKRLVGCSRSASTSRTSLIRYTHEAARLKATNAIRTLIATSATSNLTALPYAATGAIK